MPRLRPGEGLFLGRFWDGSVAVLVLGAILGSGAVGSVAVLVRTVAVPVRFWGGSWAGWRGSGAVVLGQFPTVWRWVGRGGGEAETECATER